MVKMKPPINPFDQWPNPCMDCCGNCTHYKWEISECYVFDDLDERPPPHMRPCRWIDMCEMFDAREDTKVAREMFGSYWEEGHEVQPW